MAETKIQWCDHSINPIRARLKANPRSVGHYCEKVSPGCANCYASRLQTRFHMPQFGGESSPRLAEVEPFFDDKKLHEVMSRGKPTKYFWCDMSDLFGKWVPDEWIDKCFATMLLTPQHTHQVLTKRADRMKEYLNDEFLYQRLHETIKHRMGYSNPNRPAVNRRELPIKNVWIGVSVENQAAAAERIPLLLKAPAAVRFLSCEPLLGPIKLRQVIDGGVTQDFLTGQLHGIKCKGVNGQPDFTVSTSDDRLPRINWVIVGGESGQNSRPCDVAWVRSIANQCKSCRTYCFVKQLGAHIIDRNDAGFEVYSHTWAEGPKAGQPVDEGAWPEPFGIEHDLDGTRDGYQGAPVRVRLKDGKGGDMNEWPINLRIRQFPEVKPA